MRMRSTLLMRSAKGTKILSHKCELTPSYTNIRSAHHNLHNETERFKINRLFYQLKM